MDIYYIQIDMYNMIINVWIFYIVISKYNTVKRHSSQRTNERHFE